MKRGSSGPNTMPEPTQITIDDDPRFIDGLRAMHEGRRVLLVLGGCPVAALFEPYALDQFDEELETPLMEGYAELCAMERIPGDPQG